MQSLEELFGMISKLLSTIAQVIYHRTIGTDLHLLQRGPVACIHCVFRIRDILHHLRSMCYSMNYLLSMEDREVVEPDEDMRDEESEDEQSVDDEKTDEAMLEPDVVR